MNDLRLNTISQMLEKHFGIAPSNLTRMTFGHSSSAMYEITLETRQVMLKINNNPDVLMHLEHNLKTLQALGLPVSKLLLSDVTCQHVDAAFVVLEKIPGTDLRYELPSMTQAQMTVLAKQIVDFERRANTLPLGQGFGWVALGQVALFTSWDEVVQRDLEPGRKVLEFELLKKILSIAKAFAPYFAEVQPICFLDDLTTKNVIVQDGILRGLVDFDVVCYGDPLYWLALTRVAIFADIGEPGMFYANQLEHFWGVSKTQKAILRFYIVTHAINFVQHTEDNNSRERLLEWIGETISDNG
jgi:aminoglycoside phosphotransferase (APT) family kinase protein